MLIVSIYYHVTNIVLTLGGYLQGLGMVDGWLVTKRKEDDEFEFEDDDVPDDIPMSKNMRSAKSSKRKKNEDGDEDVYDTDDYVPENEDGDAVDEDGDAVDEDGEAEGEEEEVQLTSSGSMDLTSD